MYWCCKFSRERRGPTLRLNNVSKLNTKPSCTAFSSCAPPYAVASASPRC